MEETYPDDIPIRCFAEDNEGSWFFTGYWPGGALVEGHPEHANFARMRRNYRALAVYVEEEEGVWGLYQHMRHGSESA